MNLSRLSIAGRIYFAFGSLIALMALIVAIALGSVHLGATNLDQFRAATDEAGAASLHASILSDARLAVATYQRQPDPATAEAALSLVDAVPGEGTAQYRAAIQTMIALDGDVQTLRGAMEQAGLNATNTLAALIQQASQSSGLNAKAAAISGLAMQNLLQMRIAVTDMLATPDDAAHAAASTLADASRTTLGELRATFFKTADLAAVDTVLAELDTFAATVDQVFARLVERQSLGTDVAQIDAALAASFGNDADEAAARQAELDQAAAAQSTQLSLSALVAGGIALIVGIALAFVTARWLSRAIRSVAQSMQAMAKGDFDANLAVADRLGELASIATALEVFGANGRQLRDDSTRRDDDMREAATIAARREALQHDLEAVVTAATRGDFSQRLNRNYGMPELDSLADHVNALLETVARGLQDAGMVLEALASADLNRRMLGTYQGAFSRLQADTNALAEGLAHTMTRLATSSGMLRRATDDILHGANDLSTRTSRQIAAIDTTSNAIETLSGDITRNAALADQVATSAHKSAELARTGGEVMDRMTQAMTGIADASARIATVTRLIEDIAFQTNLLALNASVEAARAGEAGKGFAVVAVEVRRLAQSTAQASADIKSLVAEAATAVQGGSRLAEDAARTLAAISQAVDADSTRMQAIATSSQAQSRAVAVVFDAMKQMDEVAQDNAALVEETNAAIEQSQAQASELDTIVGVYSSEQRPEAYRARAS
ncbi:MAG: methyl-accepting chemotaxis protein [Candidatus Devosia phytovorans]|uniref:Methyl-accepting chemotaxis protein n=1 Tax=Candidatus Devosia phytovorans TaxID=3121372 RepID=A0AAJ6AZK5_9HYPH|nr:methyl-accepting chemotaxis protein [Devosia sp.]WEK03921.1 MAG: methyl-accepting chemotaxis protein [Devosia sp.]